MTILAVLVFLILALGVIFACFPIRRGHTPTALRLPGRMFRPRR